MTPLHDVAPLAPGHSLRWRLPVLVCGLVALVLVTFLWAAYQRVEATLVQAAGERASTVAEQVSNLLDGQRAVDQLRQLSADSTLRRFLEVRSDDARQAAHTRLTALAGASPRRIELWDAAGSRLLEITSPVRSGTATISPNVLPPGAPPFVPGIRGLQQSGGVVFSDGVAEMREASSTGGPLGYLLIRSTFSENPPGIFSRLVGRGAAVSVANRTGDLWSSFSGVVPPRPVDLSRPGVAQYRAEDGEMHIGAVSHIHMTPLATWVEFPMATIVAPARVFLRQMIPIAFIVLAIAAVVISIVSARITRPLSELSSAAEAMANGDYSRRVTGERRDEIGRLGRTFNAMAGQVQEVQQRLEALVAERTARLEAANKELEAFSYSVSHDLRAPLRSIDGFSQALLEDCAGTLNEQGASYLKRVRANAQRMAELIDDLLGLARLGRGEVNRNRVNLSEIGRAVVMELRKRDPNRQVDVYIPDDLAVDADRRLVQILLENLLGNAWKFTANVASATIQVGAEYAEGRAVYFVRDNGAGFDMTYADKLFRPFQRLHGDGDFPGTGIGLATVRRIVDRHGGRVWAEGDVGAGATVYFTLPDSKEEAA
jgi:signal transduction histidine kinase